MTIVRMLLTSWYDLRLVRWLLMCAVASAFGRRARFGIVAVVACVLPVAAAAQESGPVGPQWMPTFIGEDNTRIFLDTTRLDWKSPGILSGWELRILGTPQVMSAVSTRPVARLVASIEIDCNAYRFRHGNFRFWDSSGRLLMSYQSPPAIVAWKVAPPQRPEEHNVEAACAYKRDGRRLPVWRSSGKRDPRWLAQATGKTVEHGTPFEFRLDSRRVRWVQVAGKKLLSVWTMLKLERPEYKRDVGKYAVVLEHNQIDCTGGSNGYRNRIVGRAYISDDGEQLAATETPEFNPTPWKRTKLGSPEHSVMERACRLGAGVAK